MPQTALCKDLLKLLFQLLVPIIVTLAEFKKTAWVGKPQAENTTLIWTGVRGTNPVTLYAGSINNYQVDLVPYTNYYSWLLPSGFSVYGPSSTTTIPFISLFTANTNGTYSLLCRIENNCGFSYAKSLSINVIGGSSGGGGGCRTCGGGGGGIQMRMAFPNPANDSFNVKIKEENSPEAAEITIYNKNMERVYFVRTEEKEIIVSTANLLPGLYFLNVLFGKELVQRQLIINH